jgi:hypothetical protein
VTAGEDFFGRRVLEHEPGCAGAQSLVDVLVQAECGEDQDLCLWSRVHDPTRGFDSVEDRHPYVHQDEIGAQPVRLKDGVFAVGDLADDGELWVGFDHPA